MGDAVKRFAAWLRYRRRLSRFVALYQVHGYEISPAVFEQLKQEARHER